MPDGREEPKAQVLVGKRARAGRGRRAQMRQLRARRRRELWKVSSRLLVHNLVLGGGLLWTFWCSKGAWTTDDRVWQFSTRSPPSPGQVRFGTSSVGLPQVLRSPAEITMPMPLTCRGALQERMKLPMSSQVGFPRSAHAMNFGPTVRSGNPGFEDQPKSSCASQSQLAIRKLPDNAEQSPDARAVAR